MTESEWLAKAERLADQEHAALMARRMSEHVHQWPAFKRSPDGLLLSSCACGATTNIDGDVVNP